MIEARRKARMRLIIFLLTITLGILALSQANSQNVSPANVHGTTTELVSPATIPAGTYFDHVVTILMENEGIYDICHDSPPPCFGNKTGAPFMGGLANNYTIGSQYLSLITTSQPNYVALISGSMQGCTAAGCPTPITAPNLVDRIEAAGLTWRGYFENQTLAQGCDFNSPEPYAPIHNPFIVFQDITNNTARCNKLVRVNPNSCGSVTDCILVNDLNNATAPAPNFMWLTPNDCDNMRGNAVCNTGSLIGPGDKYLSRLVPMILKSRTFTTSRSALFITFDEGNKFCPLNGSITEDCIYASWSGPVAMTNFGTTTKYTHYSFTKTIEVNWNFASLATNDTTANPMTEFFKSVPPDFTVQASPSSISAAVGSKPNSTITVASINNFAGTITLTASSSPTGPSLTLKPTSITLTAQANGTSLLTFSTSTTGNYTVTVTGTNGTLSHNTIVTFSVAPPNFAISATPGSLIIGQPSFVASSPVSVNSTGDRTVFESSYLANSFYAKGLIWLFYEDSRYTCEHQTGCLTYTTSTNGSRWATPTRVPVHITDNDFSVSTNGTSVFYVRYNETSFESSCGRNIQLGLGPLNTSGTITWQPEQTIAAGSSNRIYPNDEIIVDSNGQVWIAYMIDNHTACGGDGTDRPEVIHSAGTNYATWTGNITLSTAHSNNWHIALASLGNGQVYASFWLRNTDLHGRLFNGASWGSDEQISPTTIKNDGNAWLFNSGTNVYAIYFDNTTETFNLASRSTTGTWTINTIGTGETHTGATAFSPSYISLPDSASYDVKDNLFNLFYMNTTNQGIDQWSGSGSFWTKTTGIINTTGVSYPDSISSFIQTSPITISSIFYVSGSASPFTLNSASLKFKAAASNANFTVTITGKYGFTGTVNLTTKISPTTGLTVNCSPTSILGGSGASTCNLTSTLQGNYNVNVTGTSGSLSHSAIIAVTVLAVSDFSISASQPVPVLAGQSSISTITLTALNGFSGTVSLTDVVPSGLTCGAITPSSITGSGSATVSCSATLAANYTLTITGTSGSLTHSATTTFRFQDFTISATSPTASAGSSTVSTITIAAVNGFAGTVSLTDAVPSGLICGTITPISVTGSGTATVSCSATVAGNYTLTITGASTPLVHTATSKFTVQDFTIAATSPSAVDAGVSTSSTITVTGLNHFNGLVSLTDNVPSGLTCGAITPSSVAGSGSATVSCSATVAGNYTLTITGTSTPLVHTAPATFMFQDFSTSATSPSAVDVGQSVTSTITVTALNHFTGTVTFADTIPSGLTCGPITPSSVTGSGTATVSCSANVAGNYTITITGSSTPLVRIATATLRFQDFTTASTSPAEVNVGSSAISTITVGASNGFTGTVALTDTVPSGLTCSVITPSTINGGSGSATVSCSATVVGNFTLTITGTSTPLVRTTTAVFKFGDFTISGSSPAPVDVTQSAASTITITSLNHFAGTVSVTDTVPLGLTCGAIAPSNVTGSGTATVSCSASIAGNYTLTITGSSGSLSRSATAILRFQDFTITATSPIAVNAGQSPTSTVTVAPVNGFAGTVTFSITPSPGLSCGSLSPTSVTGSGSATVSCSATIAANYTATITGTSTPLLHNATATFQFRDFTITAASPASVNAGNPASSTITLSAVNHFAGSVSLTDTVPSGLTCGTITPSSITGSGTAAVSCNATAAGNYNLTITGTSGSLVHTTTATFRFQDFTIAASSPAPVNAGSFATSTITVASVNGFSGIVSLNDASPSGLSCGTMTPNSVTGSGTATVSCSATITGNYTLTLSGTSGSLAHSASALFQFRDFAITSTSQAAANVGVSTTSTILVTSLNHFSGIVSLSDTVPSGLACGTISPTTLTGSGTATISCHAALAGNYTLTLTGTSGQLIHASTTLFQFWDFNASASSPAPVNAGTSAISTITITATNHFNGVVSLTDTVPMGLVCGAINPTSVTGSGTATVSCNAVVAGNYTLIATGTSSSLEHNTTALFQFRDFGIAASTPLPTNAGSSTTTTITITSVNHFAGTVSLTDIAPSGLTCGAINPNSITGSGTAAISCNANIAGNYTLTVTGTSGSLNHSASALFRVQDFNISATSPIAVAGGAATTTVTVRAVNGFTGTVSLTDTIPMELACGNLTPNSIAGSGTATLTCIANSAGNYTLSMMGVSSPLSHSASLVFQVTDFTVTLSPTLLVSPVGTNATSIITITSINGFSGSISLNATVLNAVTSGGGAGGGRGALEMSPPSSIPTETLSPVTVIVPRGGSGQCTLTVILSLNVQAGNYPITITVTQGSLSHTTQLTMTATDFSLSSSASSVIIRAGSNSTMTLNLQSLNGFQGNLTLSATVSPSGPLATLNPSTLHLTTTGNSSLLTIVVPSSAPAGNYTLTVQATSGTLSHTIYITITVPSGFTTVLAGIFSSDQMAKIGLIFAASMFALVSIRAITNNKKWRVKVAIRTANRRIRTNERRHVVNASCPISVGTAWISTGIPGD